MKRPRGSCPLLSGEIGGLSYREAEHGPKGLVIGGPPGLLFKISTTK